MISTLLGFLQIIFGFLLVLFIPGFVISFVFFPRITDISPLTRLVLSCMISIGSTLCAILFLDIFLGVNTTAVNCAVAIIFLSALGIIVWWCRRAFHTFGEKRKKMSAISEDL